MSGGRTLEIAAGAWRAGIRADAGGALAFLCRADNDVLRPMPAHAAGAADAACYPLVPFAGPIRLGRFTAGGRAVRLPPNAPPLRHPVDGIGWQRPWLLDSLVGATVELVLDHGGGLGWPWPFRARQRFELDTRGLTIELSLTNEGREAMPAGLGLRPNLRRWRDSRVRFTARKVLLSDIEGIPTGETAPADHFGDWAAGLVLPSSSIDNTYRDWDGQLAITDGLGTISLQTEGASHLHVFAPGTGRDLCLSPLNHLPDALSRDDWAMPMLAPGETARMVLRIDEQ